MAKSGTGGFRFFVIAKYGEESEFIVQSFIADTIRLQAATH